MDSTDPIYWLIMGLAILIAVLALREPWDKDLWKDLPDEQRDRQAQSDSQSTR